MISSVRHDSRFFEIHMVPIWLIRDQQGRQSIWTTRRRHDAHETQSAIHRVSSRHQWNCRHTQGQFSRMEFIDCEG